MAGDNLVSLNFALAAGVLTCLCQYLLAPSTCTNTGQWAARLSTFSDGTALLQCAVCM